MNVESLEKKTISNLLEENKTLQKHISLLQDQLDETRAKLDICLKKRDLVEDHGLLLADNQTDHDEDEEALSAWVEARRVKPRMDLDKWR